MGNYVDGGTPPAVRHVTARGRRQGSNRDVSKFGADGKVPIATLANRAADFQETFGRPKSSVDYFMRNCRASATLIVGRPAELSRARSMRSAQASAAALGTFDSRSAAASASSARSIAPRS